MLEIFKQVKIFSSILSIFIMLTFHYLSCDDDTGTEYGNDGEALTKKIGYKIVSQFFAPPPSP